MRIERESVRESYHREREDDLSQRRERGERESDLSHRERDQFIKTKLL